MTWRIPFCIRYSGFIWVFFFFKYGEKTDNLTIRIHVNKIKNRITFKLKEGYYLEVLVPETKKLLGRSKCKKIKDENAENVPNLEVALLKYWSITEAALVHCNILDNNYQQDLRVLYIFSPNKSLLLKISFFQKHLIQNFRTLKYGLLIKSLNCSK